MAGDKDKMQNAWGAALKHVSRKGLIATGITLWILGFLFLDGWSPRVGILTNIQYQKITLTGKMGECVQWRQGGFGCYNYQESIWSEISIPYRYILGVGFIFILGGVFLKKES